MHDDFSDLRAERDHQHRPARNESRRSLTLQIALGIWLGGMALTLTWALLWFGFGAALSSGLTFGVPAS